MIMLIVIVITYSDTMLASHERITTDVTYRWKEHFREREGKTESFVDICDN